MDEFFDNWTVQVKKGVLELCILNALAADECYGYDLVKTLVETHGLGVTEGTVYPLLSRLRVAGLITSRLEESPSGPGAQILFPDKRRQKNDGSHERIHRRTEPQRRAVETERSMT